jgi:hypothetical protein
MLSIFQDFPRKSGNMTDEEKHTKRMVLEDRIFSILKQRYLEPLKTFWNTCEIPLTSEYRVVIVERRIHPNLEFILYNAAYFARSWSITIICSDLNQEYIKHLVRNKSVDIVPMFQGNPEPDIGKLEYNCLLQTKEFYEKFSSEYLLFMEMDTYLRKPIDSTLFQYDYVASVYSWDDSMAGGGLSFRKKSAMLDICENYEQIEKAQDIYACKGMKTLGYKLPTAEEASPFFSESIIYNDPLGVHQWWTFYGIESEDPKVCELFIDTLLTLEME